MLKILEVFRNFRIFEADIKVTVGGVRLLGLPEVWRGRGKLPTLL